MADVYVGLLHRSGTRLVFVREIGGCSLLAPYDGLNPRDPSNYAWPEAEPARERLAMSILYHATRSTETAEGYACAFARGVLQYLHPAGFWLERGAVEAWVMMQMFVMTPNDEGGEEARYPS